MEKGLTDGQPSKIDTLKTKKIFLLKHKHFSKADFKNTFSVSGQRCGQLYFQKKKKPCKLSIYKDF